MAPRSSPFRIHRESHAIHKPSSPYASSNPHHRHNHQPVLENPGGGGGATKHCGGGPAAKRPPVIIYTQSPKIIHTQAHDFMTLVQKLTGLQRAEDGKEEKNIARSDQSESTTDEGSVSNNYNHTNNNYMYNVGYEETESSSGVITEETFIAPDSSPVSSMYELSTNNLNNQYSIDAVPYFSPSSSDFSCSSSSRPSPMFGSATIANHRPVSPSFMDLVKGFPDY
ncbi:hypothetical protein OROGR_000603 [Orobanche gracilis]